MGQVQVNNTRLDDRSLIVDVKLQDLVHPCESQDDSACSGNCPTAESRSGAPGDDNAAVAVSNSNDLGYFRRRAGKHYDVRCTLLDASVVLVKQ